ncbi:MAG: MarR family transcriptional regulator [Myxococcota bacterium]
MNTLIIEIHESDLDKHALLEESRDLYEAILRFDQAAARALGMASSDLRCMNALEGGALTAGEIGRRLGLTSGSVTALVDRLIAAGLVTRRRSHEDGRRMEVQLRPEALASIAEIYATMGPALAAVLEEIPPESRVHFTRGVRRLAEVWRRAEPRRPRPDLESSVEGLGK